MLIPFFFFCLAFVAGVGKGLVGVVTRPTSGVVDFASSSFEGIRRYILSYSRKYNPRCMMYNNKTANCSAVLGLVRIKTGHCIKKCGVCTGLSPIA